MAYSSCLASCPTTWEFEAFIEFWSSAQTSYQNENFVNTSQKIPET